MALLAVIHRCSHSGHSNKVGSVAMDVSDVLKQAWTAVENARLPDKIAETAFREAMRVLVPTPSASVAPSLRPGKPAGTGGTDNGSAGPEGPAPSGDGIGATETEIFDKVVAQTGVDRDKLAEVVHLDGDVIRVSIPGIKLGKNNSEKTRVVAQVLTIVRGFGLGEADTSVELVRAEAIRLKCYDSANFSAHLGKLNGYVITGSGANRRVRAKAAGIQAFPVLVDALLSQA